MVLKMKKSSILAKFNGNLFFIIKTKNSPSTSAFIFSTIFQISKTKFSCIFWTQKCRNWMKLFTWIFYFSQVSYHLKCKKTTQMIKLLISHTSTFWQCFPYQSYKFLSNLKFFQILEERNAFNCAKKWAYDL